MGSSFTTVFQRSRNKGSGNRVEIFSGYRFVWLSRFVVPTLDIRELLRFPPKSANFPKIYNTHYRIGKHSKSFPWICDSAAVNNVTVNGGIAMGKNYRFVWLPEFIAPIYSIRELLRFSPKLTNFPENWDADYRGDKWSRSSPRIYGLIYINGDVMEGEGYRPVRFSKFAISIYSVRELLWFLPKSANFSKIYDTYYLGSKQFELSRWIRNPGYVGE